MKKTLKYTMFTALSTLLSSGLTSCKKKEKTECVFENCQEKIILKVFENEPAYVKEGCLGGYSWKDVFYFELVNPHPEVLDRMAIFPIEEIPQQHRKEGLSVRISGNVISCQLLVFYSKCTYLQPPSPHTVVRPRLHQTFLFELKSIH
jgi:hypothetical protein